jgi:CBS domain-containing protein
MKVQDVMTVSPEACRPENNLAEAVAQLWKADCGALPVVDHTGRLAGILTDRDICIALGTRNARPSEISVGSLMRTSVETCLADDDVATALARMGDRRVRRLPVVDAEHRLLGMLSLSDAALSAGTGRGAVRPAAVLAAFKTISAHPLPVRVPITTEALQRVSVAAAPAETARVGARNRRLRRAPAPASQAADGPQS